MKLPIPQDQNTREAFRIIEREDVMNYKRNQDIETNDNRIILVSPNGTRYALTVDNAGVLGTVAV